MKAQRPRYMPYEWACKYVQAQNIPTVMKYERWWEETKPPLPKKPDRVYKEWKGWNHFLRNNQQFKTFGKTLFMYRWKRNLRPVWEAIQWAQKTAKEHNLTTRQQWMDWCDAHPDLLPDDIPKWADSVYKPDFPGWPVWLGCTVDSKVQVAQNVPMVFAIHRMRGETPNVILVQLHKSADAARSAALTPDGQLGQIYQMYTWESEQKNQVDIILERCGSRQDDGSYICSNVNQLIWDLSEVLLIAR